MPTHIALLRSLNVGGKNKLRMADLAAAFETAGCQAVRTYIQSGNVIFQAPAATAKSAAAQVQQTLAADFAIHSPVILRTAAQLTAAIDALPFKDADPAHLAIAFLAAKPTAKAAAALDPDRSPGDTFNLIGRDLYLHLPNGFAKTKLTNAYLDKSINTVSTVRNWRTITKLAELATAPA